MVINRLNREIVRYLKSPDGAEKFQQKGDDIVGNTPDEFAKIIAEELRRVSPECAKLLR